MSQVQCDTTPPPFTKKGFKSALDLLLSEQVPSLGGSLSRKPIVWLMNISPQRSE